MNNISDHLVSILHNIVGSMLSGVLLWVISVKLKQWYVLAKKRRNKTDFTEEEEYINKTGKEINVFQRWVLSQTGEIPTKGWILYLLLLVTAFIGGRTFVFLLGYNEIYTLTMLTTGWLLCVFFWFCYGLEFVKHVRIIPFIIFLLCLVGWTFVLLGEGVFGYFFEAFSSLFFR